ncbi:MAG: 16S rRNA (cytosine(1402)-N(4))-methyltransferase RsmH [Tissierellia bacterium]|nr:16S rRNA (cytosine(1402)-N(4))-methyltransferase RsmH [Tissierellia bacterium]
MEFKHKSVLLDETIDGLDIKEDGIYIDGTLGGAGHSSEIVKQLKNGLLIGIDQDLEALEKAGEVLAPYSENVKLFHLNYSNFEEALEQLGIDKIDGFLLDIGVSSYQFDNVDRGFSYNKDSDLDMRMDTSTGFTAKDVVNDYSVEELTKIFLEYGEERWGKRIAEFIVEERKIETINTTFELVEIIKKAIPKKARSGGPHPARKVFQAIRIEVNDELNVLENTINKVVKYLNPGGRIAIITFHSLEDRIVKNAFRYLNLDCVCPPSSIVCTCDKKRELKIITRKPITATEEELEENNRSRSAKLRIAEKI